MTGFDRIFVFKQTNCHRFIGDLDYFQTPTLKERHQYTQREANPNTEATYSVNTGAG